ncbi:MAG: hypothetical protein KAT18_02665 [Candidatus Latescibacteria bacterium]|nr:hypothetical protein [Candidatus Latescibacterota bacterium]
MQYGIKVTFATVLLLSGLIGCSKGPGKGMVFEGSYAGHLSGAPEADITFEISGNDITGSGDLEPMYSWRGKGDPPHFTFTGTLNGRDVLISAPLLFEFNSAPYGEEALWIDFTTNLTLNGRFNDFGAITGTFGGPNPINENTPFTGTWSALKSGRESSLTRPH